MESTCFRFVIQKHWTNPLHYDLMLEKEGVLITYSVFQEPHFRDFNVVPLRKIQDHRLQYLTYEGPISGDRGSVEIWDFGTYSLSEENHELALNGKKLKASFFLLPVPDNGENVSFLLKLREKKPEKMEPN